MLPGRKDWEKQHFNLLETWNLKILKLTFVNFFSNGKFVRWEVFNIDTTFGGSPFCKTWWTPKFSFSAVCWLQILKSIHKSTLTLQNAEMFGKQQSKHRIQSFTGFTILSTVGRHYSWAHGHSGRELKDMRILLAGGLEGRETPHSFPIRANRKYFSGKDNGDLKMVKIMTHTSRLITRVSQIR